MNNEHTVKVYLGTWPATSSPLQAATAQPLHTRVKSIKYRVTCFCEGRYDLQGRLYYAADHYSRETTTVSTLVLFAVRSKRKSGLARISRINNVSAYPREIRSIQQAILWVGMRISVYVL